MASLRGVRSAGEVGIGVPGSRAGIWVLGEVGVRWSGLSVAERGIPPRIKGNWECLARRLRECRGENGGELGETP